MAIGVKPRRVSFPLAVGDVPAAAVTVAEAKDWLRITGTDDDDWLGDAVVAGTQWAVMFMGQALVTDSYGNWFDRFPSGDDPIDLFPGPIPGSLGSYVDTLTSFQYYDTGGTLTTLSTDVYQLEPRANPPQVHLKPDQVWPTTQIRHDAVRISYTAGLFAAESDVSKHFKWPILTWIAAHYRDRECPDRAGLMKAMDGLRPYQKKQQFATF